MFSLYFDIEILVIFLYSFDGRTLVLITSVPGHCLSFTSDILNMLKGISLKTTNYFFISLITFYKFIT